MNDDTKAIRGQIPRSQHREHSSPIYLTSSFVYRDAVHAQAMFAGQEEGDIYSRFTNPNTSELIEKLAELEEVQTGVVTASGMAAIFATLATHLRQGDHMIAATSLFGNTAHIIKQILPGWGINYTLVDINDREAWIQGFTSHTKLALVETPTNPDLSLIDISWLSTLCRDHGVICCVDNCFATPVLQKPARHGADIIIHSATKWIDGQGRVLGGAVLGKEEFIQPIFEFLRRTGGCLSPFNAWILSKSLETLSIRMERHCSNALALATFLESCQGINSVRYPFLTSHPQYDLARTQMSYGGGIVTIDVSGGQSEAFHLINTLKIPSITANLGDSRTIITHPATTTHSKLSAAEQASVGIYPTTLRISVGLEAIDDLIADFSQSLKEISIR